MKFESQFPPKNDASGPEQVSGAWAVPGFKDTLLKCFGLHLVC